MHSDPAAVQKAVRTYFTIGVMLLIFTGVTVAASYFNFAIPAAITVALIIAAMKGSMVAAVFMHLSHEKQWIYGALLLTVVFWIVLMFVPIATISDTIGTPTHTAAAEHAGH
jgi:caa(3)-type oxidase subunit IV